MTYHGDRFRPLSFSKLGRFVEPIFVQMILLLFQKSGGNAPVEVGSLPIINSRVSKTSKRWLFGISESSRVWSRLSQILTLLC